MSVVCIKSARFAVLLTVETMEYTAIPKGRGYMYLANNQTYKRVRTVGDTKYLKCIVVGCDGSAKLVGQQFVIGVSIVFINF